MELWLRSQGVPKTSLPQVGSVRSGSSTSIPKGYCFKFHWGGDCSWCAFKHLCPKCEGSNRALNCNFRAFGKNTGPNSQFRGPSKPAGSRALPQSKSTAPTNTCQ